MKRFVTAAGVLSFVASAYSVDEDGTAVKAAMVRRMSGGSGSVSSTKSDGDSLAGTNIVFPVL